MPKGVHWRGRSIRGLIFDYGNTLIAFGGDQVRVEFARLHEWLEAHYGPCDHAALKSLRDQQMMEPYSDHNRENNLRLVCAQLVTELYPGQQPSEAQIDELVAIRHRTFVEQTPVSEAVLGILARLKKHFSLALLSNYPNGDSVRASLQENGLAAYFDAVVVSGDPDIAVVKPSPKPFRAVLHALRLPANECLMIGDNWLADIQGAKRLGMRAIHSTEHVRYDGFDPYPGDYTPDAVITSLGELEDLLF